MTDREKIVNGLMLLAHWPDALIFTDKEKWIKPCCEMAVSLLEEQKAPERKTAHWVFGNTMGHSWMKCSECCVSQSGQTGCWTYCPNCGAEMKGETEVEID